MEGQRILLVTASMGAGHDQCAGTLAARFEARGAHTRVVDLLELLPLRLGHALRAFYSGMLTRAPWLYRAIYRLFLAGGGENGTGESGGGDEVTLAGDRSRRARPLARLGARALGPVAREFAPTAVVSTFHAAGQAVGELQRRGALGTAPAVVVITEMVPHALWLSGGAQLYCCLSEQIARRVRAATGADAIAPGPVVAESFRETPSSPDAVTAPATVLVSTGSWGVGDILGTLRTLADLPDVRPVALCGRDDRLRRRAARVPGASALGWRNDMSALLARTAVVVDNAGGSMCMEALAAGVPVVEHRPVPGHGLPVARALAAHGLVAYAADDAALAAAVDTLRRPGPERERLVAAGRALLHEDPAAAIARWLAARDA